MNRDSAFMSLRLPSCRSLAYAVGVLILFFVALFGLPNFVVRTVEFLPNSIRWILTDPKTFWAVGIITCLEWLFPANRSQPAFSVGYVQDLLYFFVWIAIVAAGVQIYVEFLNSLFKRYLGFLVIDASSLPWLALLAISRSSCPQRTGIVYAASSCDLYNEFVVVSKASARRRAQLPGAARRPGARRTSCTLSARPRVATKQMGPYPRARRTSSLVLWYVAPSPKSL